MKSPTDRYQSDAEFHMLVDGIYSLLRQARFTPTEVREAAILACCKYDMELAPLLNKPPPSPTIDPEDTGTFYP